MLALVLSMALGPVPAPTLPKLEGTRWLVAPVAARRARPRELHRSVVRRPVLLRLLQRSAR